MDIVTHGLLGALTAVAIGGRRPQAQVAVCGVVGALLPDADVLIHSASDPLLVLEYHRQFTHSLIFAPIGALVATLLLSAMFLIPRYQRQLPWPKVYQFAFIGYLSAILLDLCTSYGTQLFWPWGDAVALGIIAVVDPLFSAVLVAGLSTVFMWPSRGIVRTALLVAGAYLMLGQIQHWRAATAAAQLAENRGLQPTRIIIKPTMGNILLWRALTITEEHLWADAVRVGILAPIKIYQGERTELMRPKDWSDLPSASTAYQSLQRFYALADQLVVAHPQEPNMLGDARYAMLPTSTAPIWGIVVNPQQPDEPIDFVTRREFSETSRRHFLSMLKGDAVIVD